MLEGHLPGKRSRGRQRRRWEDCISERLGYITNEARRLAQNRVLHRATCMPPRPDKDTRPFNKGQYINMFSMSCNDSRFDLV